MAVAVVRGVITKVPFSLLLQMEPAILSARHKKARHGAGLKVTAKADQWNCSSSVEPVSAFTLDEPPWITVVTSSK